jgi:hypothetical protein
MDFEDADLQKRGRFLTRSVEESALDPSGTYQIVVVNGNRELGEDDSELFPAGAWPGLLEGGASASHARHCWSVGLLRCRMEERKGVKQMYRYMYVG